MEVERRHLRQLDAVATHRNVTQAAQLLGITQPALSRSIGDLERRLGVRLFDRLPQGVLPTPACRDLLERARSLLAEFEHFERDAQRLGGELVGEVAIGIGPAVAAGSALLELGRLLHEHPRVRCRVLTASAQELAQRLRELAIELFVADLTLFDGKEEMFELEAMDYVGSLFCRADHPILASDAPLRGIARFPIRLLGPPPAALTAVRERLREADPELPADWEPALVLDDARALTALMLESDLVGGSTAYAHAGALRSGRLVPLPLPRPVYLGRVGPVRLKNRSLSPPAELLWKWISEALRKDLGRASS
jgi:DNA-binding transcriptional LysR family regulator